LNPLANNNSGGVTGLLKYRRRYGNAEYTGYVEYNEYNGGK
jgi:hypothetical protein